ncbi:MATE family efflux transporter [Allofournierella sp.]|uniref:MATE family efflux transporter n=1 Tax=Allofournierella sp. TaxID=1940256 RepID=UPI003AB4C188
MEAQQQHDRMFGMLSPTKLFFKCALPSMVSMGVTSLYTIADGVFVGRFIGSEALAAVNLVMPLIMVSFALSDMIAVGSSVQIAIRLGQGNGEGASRVFSFACKTILALSVVMGLSGFFLAPGLVGLLGAEGQVAAMAVEYMRVYAVFAPLIMCFFAVDNYLRICGRVKYSMFMNVIISLANIVLDALLIVGLGGGIGAAALASCICLAAGSVICFWPFFAKKLPLRFVRGGVPARVMANIMANGSSEFFSNISSSVCMVLFNAVLMRIEGYRAVAAFSIVMYVDSVVKSVLFGMGDALQPALSYNYGAGQPGRVLALERRVQLAGFVISFAMMVWMLAGGRGLITLFSPPGDAALLAMSLRAMRLFALSYLVSWCAIVSSSFFTALDRPLFSLVQSTCATLLFPLMGLAALPAALGLDGVWLTGLFGGVLSALLAAVLLWRTMRRLKRRAA